MFFSLHFGTSNGKYSIKCRQIEKNWKEKVFSLCWTYVCRYSMCAYVYTAVSPTHILRDGCWCRGISHHTHCKNTMALVVRQSDLFPHTDNWLLSAPSSSALLCPACLAACLSWETQNLHLQYTNWKGPIREKKRGKSHLSLFHYVLSVRSRQRRWREGRRRGMQYRSKRACVRTYGWGVGVGWGRILCHWVSLSRRSVLLQEKESEVW